MKKLAIALCITATMSSTTFAQSCKPSQITPTHPEGQYLDNGDGTITDVVNALMWSKCSLGQANSGASCSGTPTHYVTWSDALAAANGNKSFAGHNDWRLPNIKELGDLVERSCFSPAIDLTTFPSTPDAAYWSNTIDSNNINPNVGFEGMLIDFTDGAEFLPDVNSHRMIRMVRTLDTN